jgi:nucleotidyltransferase substrate binding protein (TIGR01987 family)
LQLATRALATLQELVSLGQPGLIERDAAIQRFEYSTEACWKAAQAVLAAGFGIDAASPKGVIRACAQNGLLSEDDARSAMALIDDRNLTSHTYNEGLAQALWTRLPAHFQLLDRWLASLRSGANAE